MIAGIALANPQVAPAQEATEAPAIADNSFLLEEGYNQEAGVVQHISAFLRSRNDGSWVYTFTQEWPLFSQKSQLSFTLPVQRLRTGAAAATGIGDVALNYRYQLAGVEARASVAPRLSLLLPTGADGRGFGTGAFGVQANLPVSVTLGPRLVTHWNAGATVIPSAKNAVGAEATTTGYNLGASVVWLLRPTINLLLEVAWARSEAVTGPGVTAASDSWFVSPGLRWAHNFSGELQIVPGIAYPIGVGPSRGEDGIFFYLSFEHPF
ncbi:MAG: transporter [Gemmatimonadetes bacterium]|nr:transporter [Gemmatimonadota bacterium]